jgi:DNA-binding PadR family transcriptional regulator
VSSIRLFILGTLARTGPLHGHQIRWQAQVDRTELWADVHVGSLYGALKRLANEGLVREVRTERVGNRPERTVYEITAEGRQALSAVRDQALRTLSRPNDPFDLALTQSPDLDEDTLTHTVTHRLNGLRVQLATFQQMAETADPYLNEAERMSVAHVVQRTAAEVRWHEELLARVPKIVADYQAGVGGPVQPSLRAGDAAGSAPPSQAARE